MKTKQRKWNPAAKNRRRFLTTKKLWVLLDIALKDLFKAERNPLFRIEMSVYFQSVNSVYPLTKSRAQCCVCLAGCVMAYDLGSDPYTSIPECSLSENAWRRLKAIDSLRLGDPAIALQYLLDGGPDTDAKRGTLPSFRSVTPYSSNRDAFVADMRQLLKELKAANC